ncbi:MAG: glycosyltransferase, partial [Ornithinimicrobium sp.]
MADQHEVTVLSAQPSYGAGGDRQPGRQRVDGVEVRRLPAPRRGQSAALVSMVAFPAVVGARLATLRGVDVVMCSTVPPVTLGFVVSALCRLQGRRFIYHCMDLHPEIGALSGEFAHPLVYRALRALDTATMRRADAIVVLSADMKQSVVHRDPA